MQGFVKLVPLLMIIVLLFALLQAYTAFNLGRTGNYTFAALYGVLAIAGLALARALWVQRQKFQARKP